LSIPEIAEELEKMCRPHRTNGVEYGRRRDWQVVFNESKCLCVSVQGFSRCVVQVVEQHDCEVGEYRIVRVIYGEPAEYESKPPNVVRNNRNSDAQYIKESEDKLIECFATREANPQRNFSSEKSGTRVHRCISPLHTFCVYRIRKLSIRRPVLTRKFILDMILGIIHDEVDVMGGNSARAADQYYDGQAEPDLETFTMTWALTGAMRKINETRPFAACASVAHITQNRDPAKMNETSEFQKVSDTMDIYVLGWGHNSRSQDIRSYIRSSMEKTKRIASENPLRQEIMATIPRWREAASDGRVFRVSSVASRREEIALASLEAREADETYENNLNISPLDFFISPLLSRPIGASHLPGPLSFTEGLLESHCPIDVIIKDLSSANVRRQQKKHIRRGGMNVRGRGSGSSLSEVGPQQLGQLPQHVHGAGRSTRSDD
jgi:hypothetical protein